MAEGRNPDGTFAVGHKFAKKDFTREMARHVSSKEMEWCAAQLCRNYNEIKEEIANGTFEGEQSFFTVMMFKKAAKGDLNALQWLMEMINGKAKQSIDNNNKNEPIKLAYRE